ncbi:flavodoxin family protein [Patescibacteria group bacterium]|nr:flavodoxin family protein [Patescibacteria group bacterium]
MKIIAICGSARTGNTEFVLKRILTEAEKHGLATDLILLKDKRIEYCNGCLTCELTKSCNVRDDMQMIYSKLDDCDTIIFGSPTYFDNVTGLMKNFIDRLLPLFSDKKLSGKKLYTVAIGEELKSVNYSVTGYLEHIGGEFGLNLSGDMSLIAKGSRDIENDNEKIAQIDQFTQNIFI